MIDKCSLAFKCELDSTVESDTITLEVFDVIDAMGGPFGIAAREVIQVLSQNPDAGTIQVNIHSVGGDLFEALAIYSRLKSHPATVNVKIDGLAASAASIIAMAGDNIEISSVGWIMIHEPATIGIGMAEDFREIAELLDRNTQGLVGIYANRTGQDRETVNQWVKNETWFNAEEAVEAGLADSIFAGNAIAASLPRDVFTNTPDQLTNSKPSQGARVLPFIKDLNMADSKITSKQIREACIGADSDFVLNHIENQTPMHDIVQEWSTTQAAMIENRDKQIESLKAEKTEAVEAVKAEKTEAVQALEDQVEKLTNDLKNVEAGIKEDGPAADVSDGNPTVKSGFQNAIRVAGRPQLN